MIQLLENTNENLRISLNDINLKNNQLNSVVSDLQSECENYQKVSGSKF